MNLGKRLACCSPCVNLKEPDVATQQQQQQQHIKHITNKDLLYNTGNSIQCSVTAYMQEESCKKGSGFMYMCH